MEPVSQQEPSMSYPQEYIPSKSELLRQHSIRIEFLSRGCLIHVGCKSIPFESVDTAMTALNDYIADPYTHGKAWEKILN
jgi:hypothetical protein